MKHMVHGFSRIIHHLDQVQVLFGHHAFGHQGAPDPVDHRGPEVNAEQHDGERGHLSGLDQHHCLKKFIKGAQPAGKHNKALRVFHKHGFAGKEVAEVDPQVDPLVQALLKRQFDAEAHGEAFALHGTPVGGFHGARAHRR